MNGSAHASVAGENCWTCSLFAGALVDKGSKEVGPKGQIERRLDFIHG
jgi:hypothetical protein